MGDVRDDYRRIRERAHVAQTLARSLRIASGGRRGSGCSYRLSGTDGQEIGVFETLDWNREAGETFGIGDGRRFRIVGIDNRDGWSGDVDTVFVIERVDD
ncbi:MAG TPA: hypothetical protein VGF23_01025 [Gaiellaceae bacterium]|jgi:hypothetical protein